MNSWILALKQWNKGKIMYCVPKKGSQEYNEVKEIMNRIMIKSEKPKKEEPKPTKPAKKKATKKEEPKPEPKPEPIKKATKK